MLYDYVCPVCGNIQEMVQDICDAHTAICECGSIMHRNWRSVQIRGDEIKSCMHFDKKKGHYVKSHGDHYDIGLGATITSKSQKERLMKEKGFHEVTGDEGRKFEATESLIDHQKSTDRKMVGLAP